jgi:putative Mg2+ transporter-C (MgtC) family protein
MAIVIGGLIGAERELRDKAAGFRTMMFICVGSALFTIFSIRIATESGLLFGGDPMRIAAQIVTGVGFLGAGAILREHGEVRGLTTASTVWMVAALGMGLGGGMILFSVVSAAVIFLGLWIFPSLERLMLRLAHVRNYRIIFPYNLDKHRQLTELMESHHLRIHISKKMRRGDKMVCIWTVYGQNAQHVALVDELFQDPDITEFDY